MQSCSGILGFYAVFAGGFLCYVSHLVVFGHL